MGSKLLPASPPILGNVKPEREAAPLPGEWRRYLSGIRRRKVSANARLDPNVRVMHQLG